MFTTGKKILLLILTGLLLTACGGHGHGGSVKIDNNVDKPEKKAPTIILVD